MAFRRLQPVQGARCWGGRRGEQPITDLLITIPVEGADRLLPESWISPPCSSPDALQEAPRGHCRREGCVTCKQSVFGRNRATWEVSRVRKGWSSRGCLLGWGVDEAHSQVGRQREQEPWGKGRAGREDETW